MLDRHVSYWATFLPKSLRAIGPSCQRPSPYTKITPTPLTQRPSSTMPYRSQATSPSSSTTFSARKSAAGISRLNPPATTPSAGTESMPPAILLPPASISIALKPSLPKFTPIYRGAAGTSRRRRRCYCSGRGGRRGKFTLVYRSPSGP